jgi:hypothetical protein
MAKTKLVFDYTPTVSAIRSKLRREPQYDPVQISKFVSGL